MKKLVAIFAVILVLAAMVPLVASAASRPGKGQILIVQHMKPHDGHNLRFRGDLGQFKLDDDKAGPLPNRVRVEVPVGTYGVKQVADELGAPIASLTCSDGRSVTNLGTHRARIHVAPGELAVCIWTNDHIVT